MSDATRTAAPSSAPRIDVFNGDADGLCALQQLRLAEPTESRLVTGVKRDVRLLAGLEAPPGAALTVLDIGLRDNRADLERLLAAGCTVRWFDHHDPGEVPAHPAFTPHIDTAPTVCTSLLVDRHLGGAYRAWAVTGAFGDNLGTAAREAAAALRLSSAEVDLLRELGEVLNYNGYGETLADLHFPPAELFRALAPYRDPRAFAREAPEAAALREGHAADLAAAGEQAPVLDAPEGRVVLLPDAPWARRVQGAYANRLANAAPRRATAVAVTLSDGALRMSIRAPLARPHGAEALARQFPQGGGRAGAAGINRLAPDALDTFCAAFLVAFRTA